MSVRVTKIKVVFPTGMNVIEITLDNWGILKISLPPATTALSLTRRLSNEIVAVLKNAPKKFSLVQNEQ